MKTQTVWIATQCTKYPVNNAALTSITTLSSDNNRPDAVSNTHADIVTDTDNDNPAIVLTDAQNQVTTTQCDIPAPTAGSSTTTDCAASTSTTTGQRRTCYIGQSGRTMHARLRNHIDGLRRGDNKCPLYKHTQMSHDGSTDSSLFIAKKLTSSRTNLHRLISESEQIQKNHSEGLMNSKSEYRGTKIIRMQTHRTIV